MTEYGKNFFSVVILAYTILNAALTIHTWYSDECELFILAMPYLLVFLNVFWLFSTHLG